MVGGLTLSNVFFNVQTNNAEIVTAGTQYSMIVVGGSIGLFCQFLFERLLQATGRTLHTMAVSYTHLHWCSNFMTHL